MKHARGTTFHHLGHTTQLLGEQSALASSQSSEHYLVTFYDKLSAAAGLFFLHPDLQRATLKDDNEILSKVITEHDDIYMFTKYDHSILKNVIVRI